MHINFSYKIIIHITRVFFAFVDRKTDIRLVFNGRV